MSFAIVSIGVVAAGAVATAYVSKKAGDKAAAAKEKAIRKQSSLEQEQAQTLAQKYDREKFIEQFKLQKEADPALAAIREKSAENLLASITRDKTTAERGNEIISNLIDENAAEDPRITKLRDKLLSDAKAELDAGATLPPEFQAELVRAGLEKNATAGFSADGSLVTGEDTRRLLGREGLALEAQRRGQASGLLGLASNLRNDRINILSKLLPEQATLASNEEARAAGSLALANENVPTYGISGADAVNLELQKIAMKNQKLLAMADVAGQKAQNRAQFINSLIGTGTSAFTGIAGGGSGGIFGMLGGMMGGGQQASSGMGAFTQQQWGAPSYSTSPGGSSYATYTAN